MTLESLPFSFIKHKFLTLFNDKGFKRVLQVGMEFDNYVLNTPWSDVNGQCQERSPKALVSIS